MYSIDMIRSDFDINKQVRREKFFKTNSLILLISIISLFGYLSLALIFPTIYDIGTIVTFLFSFPLCFLSILDITRNRIKSYSIFSLTYFGGLSLYSLNLSYFQTSNSMTDFYYFFLGPIIGVAILIIFENVKVTKRPNLFPFLKVNYFYLFCLIMYIVLAVIIVRKVGFRYVEYSDVSKLSLRKDYAVPIFSGLMALFQWQLIIFSLYVPKKIAVVGVASAIVIGGFIFVSRGDIMRIIFFIFLAYIFSPNLKKINPWLIFKIILVFLFFVSLFGYIGETRTSLRIGQTGDIIYNLGSRIDSSILAWFYAYSAFVFEVLKLSLPVDSSQLSYQYDHFIAVFLNQYFDDLTYLNINGFNAATFIRYYASSFGYYYALAVIPLFIFIGSLIYICRKIDFLGLYIFVILLVGTLLFGDYFHSRSNIFIIFFSLSVYIFIKFNKEPSLRRSIST